jgi:hypothetical protein
VSIAKDSNNLGLARVPSRTPLDIRFAGGRLLRRHIQYEGIEQYVKNVQEFVNASNVSCRID